MIFLKFSTKELVLQAMIAAVYVAITFAFYSVSFMQEQFRISEILLILVLVHPKNMVGLTLGTVLANALSPVGILDVIVGSFASYLSMQLMVKLKNKWLKYLMPALVNGIIIAIMLKVVFDLPLIALMISVFASEFVVTFIPWVIFGSKIVENDKIREFFA